MMKSSMIHVLFLMVAVVFVLGSMAVAFIGAQSMTAGLMISLITVMLSIIICQDIGKIRSAG